MGTLDGQAALITGGGSGLGRAIVDRFVEEGACVAVLDRDTAKLDALVSTHGDRVVTVQGDARDRVDNATAVAVACHRFGQLDCAIGNAGIWDYSAALDDTSPASVDQAFDELFGLNVKGYIHLAKAALPALAASRGSLIFTVSNAGFDPAGGGVLYTASKHAIVGIIRQLAYEFAPAVRVNGVAPGPIETDLRGPAALGQADRSICSIGLTGLAAPAMPLGIVPTAADYTGAYLMLASRRDNRAATGGVIAVDVGIAVRGIGRPAAGQGLLTKYPASQSGNAR